MRTSGSRMTLVTLSLLAVTLGGVAHAQDCEPPAETKLVASPADGGDQVGLRVALDGETALVGSPTNAPSGAAFVFVREQGVWTQEARLDRVGQISDQFGNQVAIEGDFALVTAPRWGGSQQTGRVYPFERVEGEWIERTSFAAPSVRTQQRFGSSVAMDGGTAVIGAAFDPAVGSRSGSAHVYVRQGSDWVFQQSLFPDNGDNRFFGNIVQFWE